DRKPKAILVPGYVPVVVERTKKSFHVAHGGVGLTARVTQSHGYNAGAGSDGIALARQLVRDLAQEVRDILDPLQILALRVGADRLVIVGFRNPLQPFFQVIARSSQFSSDRTDHERRYQPVFDPAARRLFIEAEGIG